MSKKSQDLTGLPFGYYTAIRQDGCNSKGVPYWLCRCRCGNEKRVLVYNLLDGHTQSCGCLQRERSRERCRERNTTHGCANEPWYNTYANMMQRCGHQEGAPECDLCLYRDRGITVCEEWRNSPRAFGDWLLAHGWRKGLQIDRYDNDRGYSPDNCRVVTPKENVNNRRNTLRLDDGASLATFCSSLGIETRKDGKKTKQYDRIRGLWANKHKPHPELMQALKDDTDRQSRLLEITKLKCRRAELLIEAAKKLTTSKSDALDTPGS